jgi:ABC-type nitrate/sulfonate/bicarbonate transport system substrate-binding protein
MRRLTERVGVTMKIPALRRAVIFVLLIFALSDVAVAQEKIRMGVSAFSPSYASIFIANRRGFYAEEGLAVEIILIPGLTSTRALLGGSVDFASASNPNAAVQGAKLKMLMVMNDKPTGMVFAQPGIKSLDQLRGKKLGGSTVGSLDYGWVKELLAKYGLTLERDVIFVPIGSTATRFTALKAGTIDAASLSPPASFLAQDQGYPILIRTADHVEDIQASIVTTDEKLARQGPQVLRFLRATVKGQRFYLARRPEAIQAIMEFTRTKDSALMARVYDHHLTTIARDGTIPERLQRIVIDRAKRFMGVSREIPPGEIFDFSYLTRAQAEVDRSGWRP